MDPISEENFALKLRVYHLEERLRAVSSSESGVEEELVESRVSGEQWRRLSDERGMLLHRAGASLRQLEEDVRVARLERDALRAERERGALAEEGLLELRGAMHRMVVGCVRVLEEFEGDAVVGRVATEGKKVLEVGRGVGGGGGGVEGVEEMIRVVFGGVVGLVSGEVERRVEREVLEKEGLVRKEVTKEMEGKMRKEVEEVVRKELEAEMGREVEERVEVRVEEVKRRVEEELEGVLAEKEAGWRREVEDWKRRVEREREVERERGCLNCRGMEEAMGEMEVEVVGMDEERKRALRKEKEMRAVVGKVEEAVQKVVKAGEGVFGKKEEGGGEGGVGGVVWELEWLEGEMRKVKSWVGKEVEGVEERWKAEGKEWKEQLDKVVRRMQRAEQALREKEASVAAPVRHARAKIAEAEAQMTSLRKELERVKGKLTAAQAQVQSLRDSNLKLAKDLHEKTIALRAAARVAHAIQSAHRLHPTTSPKDLYQTAEMHMSEVEEKRKTSE